MTIHNLSHVEEPGGMDILEPGTYPVRVVDCEMKFADSGKKQWIVRMMVTEGIHTKKRIIDSLFFTEKALPRLRFVLDRFGVTEFGANMDGVDDDYPEVLIGREAYCTVTLEEYINRDNQKTTRNKVDFRGYSPRVDPLEPFILIAKRAPADTGSAAGATQESFPSAEAPW